MLDNAVLDDFQAQARGQSIRPGEKDYDEVRQIWNAMIDRRPALILRCADTADAALAVRFARRHQLLDISTWRWS